MQLRVSLSLRTQSDLGAFCLLPTETFLQKHRLHPGLRLHGNRHFLLHYRVSAPAGGSLTRSLIPLPLPTPCFISSDPPLMTISSSQVDHVRIRVLHESRRAAQGRFFLHRLSLLRGHRLCHRPRFAKRVLSAPLLALLHVHVCLSSSSEPQ